LLLSQVYLGRVARRHAECIREEKTPKDSQKFIFLHAVYKYKFLEGI